MAHDFSTHRVVFDPPFFTVCERDTWFAIVPKSRRHGGATLIMDATGAVLLAEIYRHPIDQVVLEIPRGGGDPDLDATAIDSALREAREEVGVDLAAARIINLGVLHPDDGILSYENQLCAALLPAPFAGIEIDADELVGYRILPFEEARAMALDGRINESHTIAAIFRLEAILRAERQA